MHIPASIAWGGPGKKWIKIGDGWRESEPADTDSLTEDGFHKIAQKNVPNVNPSLTSNGKNYNKVAGNSNFSGGMWIRVAPKVSRQVSDYDSLGSFLRKLHLSKSGENLGPFNYMLSLMELIIKWKLRELCGSAKRMLFDVIGDMVARVIHTSEYIYEMKSLLQVFQKEMSELDSSFVSRNQSVKDLVRIREWLDKLETHQVPERGDDGISLIDMPLEVLQVIVSYVDKDNDVQNLSNVNKELRDLCHDERQWRSRCYRQFSKSDIEESKRLCVLSPDSLRESEPSWHDIYLHATKNFTRIVPKDRCLLHCKSCGLIFWKGYGHPCVPKQYATYDEPVSPEKLLYYFA